jgi:hypothetical protein
LKNDNYFHVKAQQWILQHFRTRNIPLVFNTLITWSDGCAAQYKCIKNMFAMTESVRTDPDIQHLFHIFATTGQFKTPVDGAGNSKTHNTP